MPLSIRTVLVIAVPALIAVVGSIFWFRKKKPSDGALDNRKPPDKTTRVQEKEVAKSTTEYLPNGSVLDVKKRLRREESYGDLEKQAGHTSKKLKDGVSEEPVIAASIKPVEEAPIVAIDTPVSECSQSEGQDDGGKSHGNGSKDQDDVIADTSADQVCEVDDTSNEKTEMPEAKQELEICHDCQSDPTSGVRSPSNNNIYRKLDSPPTEAPTENVNIISPSTSSEPPSEISHASLISSVTDGQSHSNKSDCVSSTAPALATSDCVVEEGCAKSTSWGDTDPAVEEVCPPRVQDFVGDGGESENRPNWGAETVDLLGGEVRITRTTSEGEQNGCEGLSSTSTDSNVDAVSEDSGKGASVCDPSLGDPQAQDPNEVVSYEFDFPTDLCGRLIGRNGRNVNQIKDHAGVEIMVKQKVFTPDYQVISLEGSQSAVERGLRMIKNRFPPKKFNVTYDQVLAEGPVLSPDLMQVILHAAQNLKQLSLPVGVSVDVLVSSVVTPNHVFLQQPTHPSFPMLERLNSMMSICYMQEDVPPLPRPIEAGVICAAPMFGTWYRAQVVTSYLDTDQCDIKFVDYGGYSNVPAECLKQIRSDFTSLPFQAVECYMANIVPPEDCGEFGVEASAVLEALVHNQLVQCEVVGQEEDGTPYVQIYNITPTQSIFVNRELVEQGVARWYEHTL